jgi:hypothetical protein
VTRSREQRPARLQRRPLRRQGRHSVSLTARCAVSSYERGEGVSPAYSPDPDPSSHRTMSPVGPPAVGIPEAGCPDMLVHGQAAAAGDWPADAGGPRVSSVCTTDTGPTAEASGLAESRGTRGAHPTPSPNPAPAEEPLGGDIYRQEVAPRHNRLGDSSDGQAPWLPGHLSSAGHQVF